MAVSRASYGARFQPIPKNPWRLLPLQYRRWTPTGIRPGKTRSVFLAVKRPVKRSTGSAPVGWGWSAGGGASSEFPRQNSSQKVCQAKRGSPKPGSLTICVPSALTVPVPHVCQAPMLRSKNQSVALEPGEA